LPCGVAERWEFHPGCASRGAHRPDATHLDPYAVDVDLTEARAKSLPTRSGVTASTMIETRLASLSPRGGFARKSIFARKWENLHVNYVVRSSRR
jgi:hypothetical protein